MNNIAQARSKLKLTQQELAEKVGCSAAHVSYLESGTKTASPALAKKIAEFFEIPPSAVIYPNQPFIEQVFSP
ncbi:hypothetical protein DTO96_102543 [Ephemeroptericola cinctiostellae]|uniref:HTH cro/C1-type domain-containing protein n=1 Tax=Ephemeroptericola cinctiostellae TaxID=2268024 RepID=A0A345DEJ9_9BURK|nr:helix-turn-helix transcriptional regulator [Ephemeroptericola cinctiostellae]AXF86787.1 hypothetical protein DTO96_102543 [Ephemeroptericola cinctiostellae]